MFKASEICRTYEQSLRISRGGFVYVRNITSARSHSFYSGHLPCVGEGGFKNVWDLELGSLLCEEIYHPSCAVHAYIIRRAGLRIQCHGFSSYCVLCGDTGPSSPPPETSSYAYKPRASVGVQSNLFFVLIGRKERSPRLTQWRYLQAYVMHHARPRAPPSPEQKQCFALAGMACSFAAKRIMYKFHARLQTRKKI